MTICGVMKMTVDEKRKALGEYCIGRACAECVVYKLDETQHLCCDFTAEEGDVDYWSDELINLAYDRVFPSSAVDHPKHYQNEGGRECIEEMRLIFGDEAVRHFCMLNAYKYRFRSTMKNGAEDLKKANWYIDYLAKMECEDE